jgi:hypothetical protein
MVKYKLKFHIIPALQSNDNNCDVEIKELPELTVDCGFSVAVRCWLTLELILLIYYPDKQMHNTSILAIF